MFSKRYTFIGLLLLCGLFAQAQDIKPGSQQSIAKLSFIRPGGPGLSDLANYGQLNNTEGTPYLYDEWAPGRIRFEGQPNFSEVLDVLLDLEENELYIKLSTGYVGEFPIERLDAVEIYGPEGDTLSYEPQDLNLLFGQGGIGRRFYRVLHRGERYLVLHQPIKFLRREEYVENLGMVRRPDKYMERNEYWVFDGTNLLEIKSNMRQLSRIFPNQSSEMKRLVRTHDLDLKDTADLGRLFALMEEE